MHLLSLSWVVCFDNRFWAVEGVNLTPLPKRLTGIIYEAEILHTTNFSLEFLKLSKILVIMSNMMSQLRY